jgi:hypothetical protein
VASFFAPIKAIGFIFQSAIFSGSYNKIRKKKKKSYKMQLKIFPDYNIHYSYSLFILNLY